MKSILKLLLSVSLILTSPYGFAEEAKDNNTSCETQINCTVTQGNTTTKTTTPNTTDGGTTLRRRSSGNTTTTTTTTFGSAGTAGTGAYTQAQQAKNQANTTMITAFAMAAMLAAMCNPPHNITPCILAPLAAMAGAMAAQKKSEAQKVMNSLGTSGTSDTKTDTAGTSDGADTSAATLAKIKADLAKKGIGMNADGSAVLPNGSTVSADMGAQGLQNAGLSDSQISQLGRDLDKLKKDIGSGSGSTVEQVNVASAGGYDGGRTSLDGNDREIASSSVEAERTAVDSNAGAWSGYFKQFGDSQIGVSQSDLFIMVEKRVDSERKIMGQ